MLSSSSPGLNRPSPSCSSMNTMCRHSSRNRGFSKWPKTLQQQQNTHTILKTNGRKMGNLQGKVVCLSTWHSSAYRGPRRAGWSSAHQTLLGRPPAGRAEVPWAAGWEDLCGSSVFCCQAQVTNSINQSTQRGYNNLKNCLKVSLAHTEWKQVLNEAYLRAMLRTLVLLRMRGVCFDTEVGVVGGIEDSVWTLENKQIQDFNICCLFHAERRNIFTFHTW